MLLRNEGGTGQGKGRRKAKRIMEIDRKGDSERKRERARALGATAFPGRSSLLGGLLSRQFEWFHTVSSIALDLRRRGPRSSSGCASAKQGGLPPPPLLSLASVEAALPYVCSPLCTAKTASQSGQSYLGCSSFVHLHGGIALSPLRRPPLEPDPLRRMLPSFLPPWPLMRVNAQCSCPTVIEYRRL